MARRYAEDKWFGGLPRGLLDKFKKQYVLFARLPGLEARVRKLEQEERSARNRKSSAELLFRDTI